MQYLNNIGNDQEPKCLSCIVIEPHNFNSKFLSFLLHGYLTLQLIEKIHVIPAIALSLSNIKILPTHQLEFIWVTNTA